MLLSESGGKSVPKRTRRPGGLLIGKRPAVFELLPGENETLLVGRDPLLVLDLSLDVVDGVRGLHFQRDGLAGEGLHEYLHSTTEAKDKVERRLFLDVAAQDDGQPAWRE